MGFYRINRKVHTENLSKLASRTQAAVGAK